MEKQVSNHLYRLANIEKESYLRSSVLVYEPKANKIILFCEKCGHVLTVKIVD